MEKIAVGHVRDFPPGERRIVPTGEFSVGVFNIEGQFYALRNRCPHQGAPLCEGRLGGTTVARGAYEYSYERDGEIIKCPWHGWEFEISTGRSVFNPHRKMVRTYEVSVDPPEPEEEDEMIPTFPVTVEESVVFVHI